MTIRICLCVLLTAITGTAEIEFVGQSRNQSPWRATTQHMPQSIYTNCVLWVCPVDDANTPGTYSSYAHGYRAVTNDAVQGDADYRPTHTTYGTNVFGMVNYAYRYDYVNDRIVCSTGPNTTPVTMSAWVKHDVAGTIQRIATIPHSIHLACCYPCTTTARHTRRSITMGTRQHAIQPQHRNQIHGITLPPSLPQTPAGAFT